MKIWLSLLIAYCTVPVFAEVKLASVFSDNMVLQRQKPVIVRGSAAPGEAVSVTINGQSQRTNASPQGQWRVQLSAMQAGGPFVLSVCGSNTIELKNIMVGEVFLCSGQSNMAFLMATIKNAVEEIKNTDNPNLRLLKIPVRFHNIPQTETSARWIVSKPGVDVKMFSAVAWIMGDKLQKELKIPVGLIDASVGATKIESWISPDGFNAETTQHKVIRANLDNIKGRDPNSELHKKLKDAYPAEYAEYQKKLAELPPFKLDDRSYKAPEPPPPLALIKPATDKGSYCSLYNAMIHPLAPMTFRAIIWYQGEANRGDKNYDKKMQYLWDGWRKVFEQADLPIYFAQIAPFEYKGAHHSPELWRLQQKFADENYPAAGMVLTMDVGDLKDIHPANKRPVGERLANMCLVRLFGRKDIICDSPLFGAISLEGQQATVTFRNAKTLKTLDGQTPDNFEIAGKDLNFIHAKSTRIEGNKVIINAGSEIGQIAFVRFAWRNDAQPNLQNEAGLPAGSFRTDEGTKL